MPSMTSMCSGGRSTLRGMEPPRRTARGAGTSDEQYREIRIEPPGTVHDHGGLTADHGISLRRRGDRDHPLTCSEHLAAPDVRFAAKEPEFRGESFRRHSRFREGVASKYEFGCRCGFIDGHGRFDAAVASMVPSKSAHVRKSGLGGRPVGEFERTIDAFERTIDAIERTIDAKRRPIDESMGRRFGRDGLSAAVRGSSPHAESGWCPRRSG